MHRRMEHITPQLRKLAEEDVERMIKECHRHDKGLNEEKKIKIIARSLRNTVRNLTKNLEAHDKNDEVNYPILVKELRLQRARYLAAMKHYLPLIRSHPCPIQY
jgi:hypothetical protein